MDSSLDSWSFETPRLRAAPWPSGSHRLESQGLPSVVADLLTPAVTAPLPEPWHGPYSAARAAEWIHDRDAEGTTLLVVDRTTDEPVGLVFLHDSSDLDHPRSELRLGYLVAESRWGRGFATELVRGLVAWARSSPYLRVVAGVASNNAASRRVLEKSGFAVVSEVTGPELFYSIEV
ncbi:MAG: GNAT family N-acetyltransferase [Gemmatimonadetes bacterium]|nr:GNAT family N-acetyltransferase [Gemmatimonadota bacterium]